MLERVQIRRLCRPVKYFKPAFRQFQTVLACTLVFSVSWRQRFTSEAVSSWPEVTLRTINLRCRALNTLGRPGFLPFRPEKCSFLIRETVLRLTPVRAAISRIDRSRY